MCKWSIESNRWKHFVLGIPEGFLLTLLFAAGCGTGMEVKDCHYDPDNAGKPIWKWSWKRWDWLDWICTFCGGLVGQLLQIGVILMIVKLING